MRPTFLITNIGKGKLCFNSGDEGMYRLMLFQVFLEFIFKVCVILMPTLTDTKQINLLVSRTVHQISQTKENWDIPSKSEKVVN